MCLFACHATFFALIPCIFFAYHASFFTYYMYVSFCLPCAGLFPYLVVWCNVITAAGPLRGWQHSWVWIDTLCPLHSWWLKDSILATKGSPKMYLLYLLLTALTTNVLLTKGLLLSYPVDNVSLVLFPGREDSTYLSTSFMLGHMTESSWQKCPQLLPRFPRNF